MQFTLVIDTKTDLENVYLGLENNEKLQEPFWRREGMTRAVSGEADSGILCVIVIDDLRGTVISYPWHGVSLFVIPYIYSSFCQASMHQRTFKTVDTKLHLVMLGVGR